MLCSIAMSAAASRLISVASLFMLELGLSMLKVILGALLHNIKVFWKFFILICRNHYYYYYYKFSYYHYYYNYLRIACKTQPVSHTTITARLNLAVGASAGG